MSHLKDNWVESEVFHASNLNEIARTINNLINDAEVSYESTYSSAKLVEMIAEVGFATKFVSTLPLSGEKNTIYFVPTGKVGQNENDWSNEYMWIDGRWELLGTTVIDFSDYYTKSEIDLYLSRIATELSGKSDINHTHAISDVSGLTEELSGITGEISGLTEGLASMAEGLVDVSEELAGKSNIGHTHTPQEVGALPADTPVGDVNVIEVIKVDGTPLTPDANKAVNIIMQSGGGEGHRYDSTLDSLAEGVDSSKGTLSVASGLRSHAEGIDTEASGRCTHAEGYKTLASGNQSHAEGNLTQAKGNQSHAEGFASKAHVNGAHAEGNATDAYGTYSHVEGYAEDTGGIGYIKTNATGAHAEGYAGIGGTIEATGLGAHAEGYVSGVTTRASGNGAHAEGNGTTALNDASHAEGQGTSAAGSASHAEGNGTTASGGYSHAEGYGTQAKDIASHAEGRYTVANSSYSHAEGNHTETQNEAEHAEGQYNASHTGQTYAEKTIHSIGIGTASNDRKNAIEVMQNGDTYIYGLAGYNGANPSESQTLQEVIENMQQIVDITLEEILEVLNT